ncbi:Outer membrane efflux protein [Thermanaeromonas toyohensis ToBE]|uniref:Outer membrane efflux protein n=1 Tax=Thermanaeromonas toyohensis ToBE TaxID=698762 RepID=A0A1W1V987_9FIRM|nr:TolC family protein [Thermanaeromonas toyohensis]SMB89621.1 Outer membrane efflux protein [Thermanaeromonas toyohensis ToBE]
MKLVRKVYKSLEARRVFPLEVPLAEILLAILMFFVGWIGWAGVSYGDEAVPETLSLEDAVHLALLSSKEVQVARETVELKKTIKDETWDKYNAVLIRTHIPGTDMYVSLPTGQDPTGMVFKTDYDWRKAERDYEVKVASVVASVYQKYSAAVLAQKQVEVAKLNVALKERELADAEARFKVGAESALVVAQKRASLASARSELAQAEGRLNKAYADLVELVGLPRGSKPALVSQVDFAPLKVEDLDKEIETIIEASPQVWTAQETVKLQKNTYGMVNSYDVDKINLKLAEIGVDITRQQLYLALLQLYNNVKALEENYEALQQSLTTAQEGLRIARLKYELGMATRAEVLSAEASVVSLLTQLENVKWQHAMAVRAFYEPWAWSGGGIGGASSTSGQGGGS